MTWEGKPLKEILTLSGRDRAGDRDLPVLSITMKHGLVDQADKFKKRVASFDTSNYRIAFKNELVVGFPIDEGVLGFQTKYPEAIVSPAYDIWRLNSQADCHIPYLERYLRSTQARSQYASRMQGAVARRRSLTKDNFLDLEIPFPPVEDQIRIAHLLGKTEELIAQRKQHLQQLEDLLKSVFLNMFGDPVRNEKGWTTGTSTTYADMVTVGVVVKPASHYVERGVIALRSLNVKPNRIDLSDVVYFSDEANEGLLSKSRLKANDVVVVRTGKTGTAAVVPVELDGANCIDLIVVRPRPQKIRSQFLTCLLNSERGMALVSSLEVGGIQKHFNVSALKEIPFPLPPLELQDHFAGIFAKVQCVNSLYERSLTDLEGLHNALSYKAFRGELDLSRVPLPNTQVEEERAMPSESLQTPTRQGFDVKFPDTGNVLDALENAQVREDLMSQWLAAYRSQLGAKSFSVQHFLAAAQTRLAELHPDSDFALGANDYEHIKGWVFDALAAGTLMQAFDDEGNRIELRAASA